MKLSDTDLKRLIDVHAPALRLVSSVHPQSITDLLRAVEQEAMENCAKLCDRLAAANESEIGNLTTAQRNAAAFIRECSK